MQEIIRTDFGFTTVVDNGFADKVDCYIHKGTDEPADCIVHLKDGSVVSTISINDASYVRQYGTPVSESGILFAGGWYAKEGLRAYDVMTGEQLWHLKKPMIRKLLVRGDYIIAHVESDGIYKLNAHDGSIAGFLKTSGTQFTFHIENSYILADRIRGNLVLLDTDTMEIVRKYPPSVFNPEGCIRDAYLVGGKLEIEGFTTQFKPGELTKPISYTRIIDDDFKSVYKK